MQGFDYLFFLEVLTGGLLSGVMYSLVAIGFVLIYKTSGVLNFAQGALLLFAALTFVSLVERGWSFPAAFAATLALMVLIGLAVERTVLRPLVNKPPITLFMATLGLSYIIEGLAQLLWGTQVHELDLGIQDVPLELSGVLISRFDLFAALWPACWSPRWRYSSATPDRSRLPRRGRRPVCSTRVGLRLPRIWATVWAASGLIALVAAFSGARGAACSSHCRSWCSRRSRFWSSVVSTR